MSQFVHLHVHTQYSLLDGAIRLKDLFETAKSFNMPAVAITDHGNMFGALEFYEMAKKAGIKAIVGCEVYVALRGLQEPRSNGTNEEDRNHHLVLLARDLQGYQNLMKIVSHAWVHGFYYKPRTDKEFLRSHSEGLIALSACLQGEVANNLLRNQEPAARKAALDYAEIFGPGNFYLELQSNGLAEQVQANAGLIKLARELDLPLVATNDCHYLRKQDARAHEILLCIQTGKTILDEKRMKFQTDQLYFKSPEEMAKEFASVPEALENALAIAERCDLKLKLGEYHFPVFPVPPGESLDDNFEKMAREGFKKRLDLIRRKRSDFSEEEEYAKRLDYELEVIKKMGFSAYFLIVADFINWAKDNGVPVGPGRGSAAGSLVAYAMSITDLDPIEHGLIFERFLNVERISMPDIDVDFCVNGRSRVFDYVREKYGRDNVCQIATFGTMMAKAVVRDVGRVLAMPYNEVDKIAKLIPAAPGMTLKKAFEIEPRLVELKAENPQLRELFEISSALEALTRHASTHAAGVVMADKPIVEYMPLYKDQEGGIVSQFSMKYVEKAGLIKFDFLGLRNLTVIQDAVNLIQETRGVELKMEELPLEDKESYELLGRGDTTGVFQLESSGMRDILVRLKPELFADIVALVALYRPGPLESGMVDSYIDGKHGRIEITYDFEQLRPILEPTYGVILYQEQVMKIASVLANYTLGEADLLRRAMGKKIPEVMAEQRGRFIEGAKQNKLDIQKANHIFDLMEKFAGYGFNKSHSAAYALVAYHTAYLKAHYAVEFMAALMNSFLNSTDQVVKMINECREKQIEILPPDVNASSLSFTVVDGKIRFGLGAVKNVGETAIEVILASRKEKGPFRSLFDFCQRMDSSRVNRRVIEQLVRCGAFDSVHPNRASVMANLDDALNRAQVMQRDRQSGQKNMFEVLAARRKAAEPPLPDAPPWDMRSTLQFEKESLGFYISGHPLDAYQERLEGLRLSMSDSIPEKGDGAQVMLCGMVSVIKELTTKKGDRMGFLALEDKAGVIEIVAFAEAFSQARPLLEFDEPLVVIGKIQHDEKGSKVLADRVLTIDDAATQMVDSVRIRLAAETIDRDGLARLRYLLMSHPGECKVLVHLRVDGQAEAVIAVSEKLKVGPTEAFVRDLTQCFGKDCLEMSHKTCLIEPQSAPQGRPYRRAG